MSKTAVLAIEDEKDLLKVLRYNLEKEGYEFLESETGEKGFELAKAKRPDLVILDLMLPEMDGFEVCRLLKVAAETKNIPVLMLTAKNTEVDEVVGLELGASDFMTKPFNVKVLLARVKNLLKRAKSGPSGADVLRVGDFAMDKDRYHFAVKGKSVPLTKIEFSIMASLLEKPGFVISRELLVSSVWGGGAFVSAVAVNMHVMKLRAKLGRHGASIETVRGTGYRLVDPDA